MKKLLLPIVLLISSCNKPEPTKNTHIQFKLFKVGNDTLVVAEFDPIKVEFNRQNQKCTVSWL